MILPAEEGGQRIKNIWEEQDALGLSPYSIQCFDTAPGQEDREIICLTVLSSG